MDIKHEGETVTFHLRPYAVKTPKWCVYCRNLLFASKHRVVSIADESPLEADFISDPIELNCSKCRVHVSIQTIL